MVAKELTIAISFSIPPYVIKDQDRGIELDILREAFKLSSHQIKVKYLPLARTFRPFEQGKVDGLINTKEGMVGDAYYSDVVIAFNNCAISLAKNNYPDFKDVTYLRDKKVIAFQRASTFLGKDFLQMSKLNKNYREYAKQKTQIIRLFFERQTDFVIMDSKIFEYYRKELKESNLMNSTLLDQKIKKHCIFEPSEYKFAFSDAQIRDDFNAGLASLKKSGKYQEIINKYN